METVKENAQFLSKLIYESKATARTTIKQATDKEIVLLIELILNFDAVGDSECSKTIQKKVSSLKKIKWKLTSARKVLSDNLVTVQAVASSALVFLIKSEICDIF